tara:strand:- start:2992 stop:3195 length:204 start_codon:yes stop_codon:yes gene_type:complete
MKESIKFTIAQDGTVTQEVQGVIAGECLNMTKEIEEQLGTLQTRQFKPEFYSQRNVSLQYNQNKVKV